MNILARLDKKKFDVYKVIVIKELKQSRRVKLAPVDQKGEVISGDWSEYNMPNGGTRKDIVRIKYRVEGRASGFGYGSTAYRNITEYCPRSTDLKFLFEAKEKENKEILLYILKENKKTLEERNRENESSIKFKTEQISTLQEEVKKHKESILDNMYDINKINNKIKLLEAQNANL